MYNIANSADTSVTQRRLATGSFIDFTMKVATSSETAANENKVNVDAIGNVALTGYFRSLLASNSVDIPHDLAVDTEDASAPQNEDTVAPTPAPTQRTAPEVVDACFPADAAVLVKGQGRTIMADLAIGDAVLVSRHGSLVFEPVLSFLHTFRGSKVQYFAVRHTLGEIRATPGHILMTAAGDKPVKDLMPGDSLLTAGPGGDLAQSAVLALTAVGGADAYAPLTAAGTIVVDNVVASNYASPATLGVRHAVAHALLFPVRAYHALGFSSHSTATPGEELHPFLELAYRKLRVDGLHAVLAKSQ